MDVYINELAKALYHAYLESVGGVSVTGQPLPAWQDLIKDPNRTTVVNGWIAVANKADELVFDHYEGDEY